jgi:flavin reductase (DIM6/NTAB) family NADH-FMN oxidoreductase RutF
LNKAKLGPGALLYPMPVTLVGANVGGRANFMAVAYVGVVGHKPPMIAIGLRKTRHTSRGIIENETFSVNIPSKEMLEATDYCGIVSGKDVDKSGLFEVFYGVLKTAPMIGDCPVCLECGLSYSPDSGGSHQIFIGEVAEVYADEECLTRGRPDMGKINPFVYSVHDSTYWAIGSKLAKAFSAGKGFEKKN